jgi:hypothetical protein
MQAEIKFTGAKPADLKRLFSIDVPKGAVITHFRANVDDKTTVKFTVKYDGKVHRLSGTGKANLPDMADMFDPAAIAALFEKEDYLTYDE